MPRHAYNARPKPQHRWLWTLRLMAELDERAAAIDTRSKRRQPDAVRKVAHAR
jgi:hypothetical protein